ncbi:50S ribosomal protein L11 methyltransferase [Streptomyces sp. MNU76]|uniref:50S ribosomal protein L11 methyltransferase n=1 Tax=Streptomyces sp. MNU76 TaxID=2560026 RepID=UPI001E51D3E8|nr:50S ribosomal protein L11 methyltransferase [Streptomyces sp. MNU76]MCC9707058.1 50S ribosomal protein L11 methyltransferase [Streptomyces sp. MNU76]
MSDTMPAELLGGGNRIVREAVPCWHFAMMNDQVRNQAFREAIEKTVRYDDLVLDIGTGGGLTALIATRAGAQVITCEANPVTALLADRVVRANGYGDRITVVPKPSTELVVGRDLPRRADVLSAEVFDCGLPGEFALPALEHAQRELLTPGARLVPAGGRLWAQIIESEDLFGLNNVGMVDGFDLTAFNLATTQNYFPCRVDRLVHTRLTPAFPLFDFGFANPPTSQSKHLDLPATANGTANAAVMWFELDLGNDIKLSNQPGRPSHWHQAAQTFGTPLPVTAGATLHVTAEHDLTHVTVNLQAGNPRSTETSPDTHA